ncbi:MAG: EAL domain-containing protein [Lachnospiraceae bacterium]|nr:EAL domain-containing protein [Lachnospiraceae bacterium]
MGYMYQYDIAAIILTIVLLVIFCLRKIILTKSTYIYLVMICWNLLTAMCSLVRVFVLEKLPGIPQDIQFVSRSIPLFTYHAMTILFLLYMDARTRIPKYRLIVKVYSAIAVLLMAGFALTTPMTHFVLEPGSGSIYHHGPGFLLFYIVPGIVYIWIGVMIIQSRKKLNSYQGLLCWMLVAVMFLASFVALRLESVLIGTMIYCIALLLIYIAFENPAYYTYQDTPCLNKKAFISILNKYKSENRKIGIVGIQIQDYEYMRHNRGEEFMNQVTANYAAYLYSHFRHDVFAISDNRYVVIYYNNREYEEASEILNAYFEKVITVGDSSVFLIPRQMNIPEIDLSYAVEDLERLIHYCMEHPDDESDVDKVVEGIIASRNHYDNIVHLIRRAIFNDDFEVYYQPIYNVKEDTFTSAEALIRLNYPEEGFINPEELITIAEENGYINQIGDMIFGKVCKFVKEEDLQSLGVRYVDVNLSPMQCIQPDLSVRFRNVMQQYAVDPTWINLEITETAQVTQNRKWLENVQRLHAIGVTFAIDDYGSGFASADYLIKLPMSIVKIDKMILWQAMKDPQAMIVLTNTIRMIHELGKKIVVEGVEDENMIRILSENKVEFFQGFYYSKPIPEKEYIKFLKEHNHKK